MLQDEMMKDAQASKPSDEGLKKVAAAAEEMLLLEASVEELDRKLTEKKKQLQHVAEHTLPEAMAEVGMAEFKLNDGSKITVKPFYSATINDSNRDECHSWLREHGHGDLIKHQLIVDLLRGKDDVAQSIKQVLVDSEVPFTDKEGVHSATLTAFVREQVEKGKALPLEKFKVFIGRKAKVSAPKKGERI